MSAYCIPHICHRHHRRCLCLQTNSVRCKIFQIEREKLNVLLFLGLFFCNFWVFFIIFLSQKKLRTTYQTTNGLTEMEEGIDKSEKLMEAPKTLGLLEQIKKITGKKVNKSLKRPKHIWLHIKIQSIKYAKNWKPAASILYIGLHRFLHVGQYLYARSFDFRGWVVETKWIVFLE